MSKIVPAIKIDKCTDCPYLIHEDYQEYVCYKLQDKIRNTVDCYVFHEIYQNCPLEEFNIVGIYKQIVDELSNMKFDLVYNWLDDTRFDKIINLLATTIQNNKNENI